MTSTCRRRHSSPAIHGGVADCVFHRALSFPDRIDAALRVGTLGRTSVRYEVELFRAGEELPAATGYFVHVFVDRASRRPTPIVGQLREALERLLVP